MISAIYFSLLVPYLTSSKALLHLYLYLYLYFIGTNSIPSIIVLQEKEEENKTMNKPKR